MSTTYAQKQAPAQKKDAPTAASVLDASSQSKSLQRKADMANSTVQREEAPRPNNTGMPDNLKSGIESLSGFSMDDVRVHYNSSKPATVQALAYTQGTDIHVAPGQEKHLPHEAWHVAQQMAGRVSPTTNINGMPVNDNAALEHEADVMGEKAVGQRKITQTNELTKLPSNSKILQCGRSKNLLDSNQAKKIVKINFAGSSYKSWGYQEKGTSVSADKYGLPETLNVFIKAKSINNHFRNVIEYSFPGPMGRALWGAPLGTHNSDPSISQLVAAATRLLCKLISDYKPFYLIIKGHSRGAVAAGLLYNNFANDSNINGCDLIMLDPVPGDDNIKDNELTSSKSAKKVVFYSLGIANQGWPYNSSWFKPQKIANADIIILCKEEGHSCYVDSAEKQTDKKKAKFTYNETTYTYAQLCNLPRGVYTEKGNTLFQANLEDALNILNQNYASMDKSRKSVILESLTAFK